MQGNIANRQAPGGFLPFCQSPYGQRPAHVAIEAFPHKHPSGLRFGIFFCTCHSKEKKLDAGTVQQHAAALRYFHINTLKRKMHEVCRGHSLQPIPGFAPCAQAHGHRPD